MLHIGGGYWDVSCNSGVPSYSTFSMKNFWTSNMSIFSYIWTNYVQSNLVHMELLGKKFRRLRERRNLPLRKVAASLDIDPSILSKIERSARTINIELLSKLSKYYEQDFNLLKTEFHAEQIANVIYEENEVKQIFAVAEEKIEYLKSIGDGKSS